MKPLYKTVMITWSEDDPTAELDEARAAGEMSFEAGDGPGEGPGIISRVEIELVKDPDSDPDFTDEAFTFMSKALTPKPQKDLKSGPITPKAKHTWESLRAMSLAELKKIVRKNPGTRPLSVAAAEVLKEKGVL